MVTSPVRGSRPALSDRARSTQSSAIRDLLDQATRPGMISLAGGLPDPTGFPLAALAHSTAAVFEREGSRVLQYGPTRGDEAVRASLASLFDSGGPSIVDPDALVVTTGSQQGLDLIARVLLDPGDVVVVGEAEYLGALQVWRSYGADLCPIPIDRHGLCTERLEQLLRKGLRPKACYVVPHFHNPTGATLSVERRHHLHDLAARYGFLVLDDDPYRELHYDGARPGRDIAYSELTVRLRSTSKILAPGLRVGALAGPAWLVEAVVTAKQSCDLHSSSLDQAIVAEALQAPWLDAHLEKLRQTYREKRDVLVDALRARFGSDIAFEEPTGGMFVWAEFSQVADTTAWLGRCLDNGVCFVPGDAFALQAQLHSHARLSFSTATPVDLIEGVDRMAAAR